jgi:hypothetical protein
MESEAVGDKLKHRSATCGAALRRGAIESKTLLKKFLKCIFNISCIQGAFYEKCVWHVFLFSGSKNSVGNGLLCIGLYDYWLR